MRKINTQIYFVEANKNFNSYSIEPIHLFLHIAGLLYRVLIQYSHTACRAHIIQFLKISYVMFVANNSAALRIAVHEFRHLMRVMFLGYKYRQAVFRTNIHE
jgi:hypothetical protein